MADKDKKVHKRSTNDQDVTSTREQNMAPENQGSGTDYDKLNTQGISGTRAGSGMQTGSPAQNLPGGASIPDAGVGSGTPPGGISTSDSTVAAGGTAGGGTPGLGSTTERGRMPTGDELMHSEEQLKRQSGGTLSGQEEFTPGTAPGGQVSASGHTGGQRKKGQGGRNPLSREEAEKINEDARLNSGVTPGPDVGHEREDRI